MHLLALTVNHRTAPVELRERVAVSTDRLRDMLTDLHGRLPRLVPESAMLSTCQRTELYCAVSAPDAAHRALIDWLAETGVLARGDRRVPLDVLRQHEAVRHVFRVASGLDSMVLGEPQILGQMKEAARYARAAGTLGAHLHQLLQRSFAVAKDLRTNTDIGSSTVSMAGAAVRLAQSVLGDLSETRVLFIGAGAMIGLVATHFAAQHPRTMVVANRTLEHAQRIARRVSARAVRLADVPGQLEHSDVVVSCTASPQPLLRRDTVERSCRLRERRPMVMVDLAVPRDIEPEVGRLPDVCLYTVDDLGEIVRSGASSRHAAVAQAEAIIDARVESFMRWMAARGALPLLRTLDERAAMLRDAELRRAYRRLGRGQPIDTVLTALATGLSNKFLHAPRSLLSGGTLAPDEAERLVEHCLAGRAAGRS